MSDKKNNSPADPNQPRRISVEVPNDIETGNYSNFLSVYHSPAEFILDFGMFLPGKNQIKIVDRVISNPLHAKQFLIALQDNIKKFEAQYGEIQTGPTQPPMGPGSERIN